MKQDIILQIKESLPLYLKEGRIKHTYGVVNTALELAKIYNADCYKIEVSALLHDIGKQQNFVDYYDRILKQKNISHYEKQNPSLLHSYISKIIAEDVFHITDEIILSSIENHTLGKPNMNVYDAIIFVSDYIEPNRNYNIPEMLINSAKSNLRDAVLMVSIEKLTWVLTHKNVVHPIAIDTYNYFLENEIKFL